MLKTAFLLLPLVAFLASAAPEDVPAEVAHDVQLRAMQDELIRAKSLQIPNLEKPYYVAYASEDNDSFFVSASLGGLLNVERQHVRVPRINVRVGNFDFDNTNYILSDVYGGSRYDAATLSLEDDYNAFRTTYWLATDRLYKTAAEAITKKRNALRDIANTEQTADFSPSKTLQLLRPAGQLSLSEDNWTNLIKRLSERFAKYPDVDYSSIQFRAVSATTRFVNTEGSVIRVPEQYAHLQIRASARAADGSQLWNSGFLNVVNPSQMPKEEALAKLANQVAEETQALAKAPLAEEYSGPVLFEDEAAAQMMAAVLSDALRLSRKPVTQPGQASPFSESVWANRLGSKVLPDWMSLIDDPTAETAGHQPLFGHFEADLEGVAPQTLTLVDKGVLQGFFLTRQPVKTFNQSNGRARLPGRFGTSGTAISNLFVKTEQSVSTKELRAKLLDIVKAANRNYGIVIKKLDFPSTASVDQLQHMFNQLRQEGASRSINAPLVAYRLYPDGREELIRGVRFKDFSARNLKDIQAASNKPYVLNYINNGSSYNWANAPGYVTESSVICPSLLFDNLDLDRAQDDLRKLPIVPPPSIEVRQ